MAAAAQVLNFGDQARELVKQGQAAKDAPFMSKMAMAMAVADETAAFLVEMADALDALNITVDRGVISAGLQKVPANTNAAPSGAGEGEQ